MDLGLDTLTDDQIVELARAIAAELSRRSPATVDAAKAAVAAATARAVNDQDQIWTQKKWLAAMVVKHIGARWSLNVWCARDRDETRVYLETEGGDRKGREILKYCYYVTGGAKHAPGTLTIEREGSRIEKKPAGGIVRIIAAHAARLFPEGLRLDCDEAAALTYQTPDEPQDLRDALAKASAAVAAKAAREAYEAARRKHHFGPVTAERDRLRAEAGIAEGQYDNLTITTALTPLREAAQHALAADMVAYDAEHGSH